MSKKIQPNENQQSNNEYIPGQCNLGLKEIESRKRKSISGLIVTILFIAFLQFFNFPIMWRLLVFIPVFYTILCYYQAQRKFCVAFGIMGVFNFGEIGKTTVVSDEEFKKQDKSNAWKIIFKSLVLTTCIVAVYFLLPI